MNCVIGKSSTGSSLERRGARVWHLDSDWRERTSPRDELQERRGEQSDRYGSGIEASPQEPNT